MAIKKLTCIICPRGCQLEINDQTNEVTGNNCIRGKNYAISELTNPVRNIATTIRVSNIPNTVVSVKTDGQIPKSKIFEVMKEINKVHVEAPCKIGQIVIENVCNTGINVVITKNINL